MSKHLSAMVCYIFLMAAIVFLLIVHARLSNESVIKTYRENQEILCRSRNVSVSDTAVRDFINSKLKREKYRPVDRPIRNAMDSIKVTFGFVLHGIITVSEKEGFVTVYGYISLEWMNEYAIWNDTWPYFCVNTLNKRTHSVWIPDVALINSADDMYGLIRNDGFLVRVFSNGETYYSPGGEISFYCPLNLALFPFDQHNCSLEFEAWSNNNKMQHFALSSKPISLIRFDVNEQWELIGTDAALEVMPYNSVQVYHQAKFTLTLKRKSGYYVLNVIFPSFVISLVELVTFSFQEDDVVKVHVSFTCLLSYSVFQVMIIGDMPRISQNLPLLSIYIVFQMALIGFKIILEGIVYVFYSYYNKKRNFPDHYFNIFKVAGKFLFVSSHSTEEILIVRLSDTVNTSANRCTCPSCRYIRKSRPSNLFESSARRRRNSDLLAQITDDGATASFLASVDQTTGHHKIRSLDSTEIPNCNLAVTGAASAPMAKPPPSITVSPCVDEITTEGILSRKLSEGNISYRSPSVISATQACSAAENSRRWIYAAQVVDRFTLIFYLTCITIAPVVMFIVMPSI